MVLPKFAQVLHQQDLNTPSMARGLAVAALAAVVGSLAFVPGALPRGTTATPRHAQATPNMQTESGWDSLPTLMGGMALGLLFSLATVAPVRAEEAAAPAAPAGPSDEEILAKGCDIRKGCPAEQQMAWAKAYYRCLLYTSPSPRDA